MIRRLLVAAMLAVLVMPVAALAQGSRKVEVVEVRGPIDTPVMKTIISAIEAAERDGLEAVVLQIDSKGSICPSCTRRIIDAIGSADVAVVTWVGPPGGSAENAAEPVALSGHIRAIAPGATLGPFRTSDLRRQTGGGSHRVFSADDALDAQHVDVQALQLPDLLRRIDGRTARLTSGDHVMRTDPDELSVRFRKPNIRARLAHAVALPSYAYLLLLVALALFAFELFHPGTQFPPKPGIAHKIRMVFGRVFISMWMIAVLAGGYSVYGLTVTGAWWPAVAMLVAATVCFSVDLRYEGFGLFTLLGTGSLIAGSLLLYRGSLMRIHPAIIVIGCLAMWLFFVSAMTRVVRDLRAVARGEREIVAAHPSHEDHDEA